MKDACADQRRHARILREMPTWNCRVCGLLYSGGENELPWGADAMSPTYGFCDCCGVVFGYGDATPEGARRWRRQWLEDGSQWHEPNVVPDRWRVEEQLAAVPEGYR